MFQNWRKSYNFYTIILGICLSVISCSLPGVNMNDSITTKPKECTLRGCVDSLSINVDGNIPDEYSVYVVGSDGEKIGFQCHKGKDYPEPNSLFMPVCDPSWGFWLRNFSPDVVTITIKWKDNTFTKTFEPKYVLEYPNGPDCPPGCKVGSIRFSIPNP